RRSLARDCRNFCPSPPSCVPALPPPPTAASSAAAKPATSDDLSRNRCSALCPVVVLMLSTTYRRFILTPCCILRRLMNSRAYRVNPGNSALDRKSASSERITSAASILYCGSTYWPKAIFNPARAESRLAPSHWYHFACGCAFKSAVSWLASVGDTT